MTDNITIKQTEYRISVAGSPGWREKDTCSLEISMGNPKHEGIKLRSLIRWADENFENCLINIGDTLQRHNLRISGLSAEEAHKEARKMGDDWLARNAEHFDELSKPYRIFRWDHWISDDSFDKLHKDMWLYYNNNEAFRACVEEDAMFFVNKRPDLIEAHGEDALKQQSIAFLIEEAAGDTILSRQMDIARVYPATQFNTFQYLSRPETPNALAGLGRDVYTRVNYKKRKAA